MKRKKKVSCKHKFEIIDKKYNHWEDLEEVVILCPNCGEVRKIEIEGKEYD
jgi:predicted RNA-binding Zn-ribbon protein involved in translation (DUF1610 family)